MIRRLLTLHTVLAARVVGLAQFGIHPVAPRTVKNEALERSAVAGNIMSKTVVDRHHDLSGGSTLQRPIVVVIGAASARHDCAERSGVEHRGFASTAPRASLHTMKSVDGSVYDRGSTLALRTSLDRVAIVDTVVGKSRGVLGLLSVAVAGVVAAVGTALKPVRPAPMNGAFAAVR